MLTPEQKQKYVEHGGTRCPFCGSVKLDSDPLRLADSDSLVISDTTCMNCRKEWLDIYKLTDIQED